VTPRFLSYRRWLAADARNRALRTVLQGVVAVVLVPVGDAVVQVLQAAFADAVVSHRFDWHQVLTSALVAAGTAATMAVAAYLHRLKLDPTGIPSAAPPPAPVTAKSPASVDPPPAVQSFEIPLRYPDPPGGRPTA
jgi:hypothetical protein